MAENNVKTVNSDQLAVISKKKQANTSRGEKDSLGEGEKESKEPQKFYYIFLVDLESTREFSYIIYQQIYFLVIISKTHF